MSAILDMYNSSTKVRVEAARLIPAQAVNFTDQNNVFEKGFATNMELKQTNFTDKALNYFDDERLHITIPDSFQPTDVGINLDRWNENAPYFSPGQAQN